MEIKEVKILNKNLQHTRQYMESFIIVWWDITLETNNHISKMIEK